MARGITQLAAHATTPAAINAIQAIAIAPTAADEDLDRQRGVRVDANILIAERYFSERPGKAPAGGGSEFEIRDGAFRQQSVAS